MQQALAALLFALSFWLAPGVRAEADGPDYWRVTGVARDDVLNLRTEPNARARRIARIPPGARGLKNFGCQGGPTFQQWQAMSAAERARSARSRWCKVGYNGMTGWVAGRFLAEDGAPPTANATPPPPRSERRSELPPSRAQAPSAAKAYAAWTVRCDPACRIEQNGSGTPRATLLRIEPDRQNNARITILRANVPATGTVTIYMDGEMISAGPLAELRATDGNAIEMPPNDITQGLMRQMARHKNMVIALPDDPRGVEIRLDGFAQALSEARRRQ